MEAARLASLTYVTYNIWTKDNEPGLTPEWVYWHAVNVRNIDRGDVDRLSFELLSPAERKGGIILMHNGRQASVDALGPFNGLPGIIPYLYDRGFIVRKLPTPPITPG